MKNKKPNTKPTAKSKCHSEQSKESKLKQAELNTITFSEIENIQMLVIVKGKSHLLVPKLDFKSQSKLDMECALRLVLDSHIIMDPSID